MKEETYTQWFANGCWFDVPVRPHTDNEFVPSRPHMRRRRTWSGKKDEQSRQSPPAIRADPLLLFTGLSGAFLRRAGVVRRWCCITRTILRCAAIGHEKLIGRDLLVGIVARTANTSATSTCPRGSGSITTAGNGSTARARRCATCPLYRTGSSACPRSRAQDAILPMMHVDEDTKDAFGHRMDGDAANEAMIVQVYADAGRRRASRYTRTTV